MIVIMFCPFWLKVIDMSHVGTKPKIYVVGSSVTQNELLAHHIETSLGYPCVSCQEIDQIPTDGMKNEKTLILLDYKDGNWKTMCNDIKQVDLMGDTNECFLALFNVNPVNGNEKEIAKLGIRGIFHINYSRDVLLKGIKAVLKEELWLPRALINTIFLKHQNYETSGVEIAGNISLREKQILDHLSAGYTNDMIADKLCISIHTVKTHIYNIYRKINVKNRLQAVRWVNNNLRALG
jgi:DNA-binding CsgD family transcriptional regulator